MAYLIFLKAGHFSRFERLLFCCQIFLQGHLFLNTYFQFLYKKIILSSEQEARTSSEQRTPKKNNLRGFKNINTSSTQPFLRNHDVINPVLGSSMKNSWRQCSCVGTSICRYTPFPITDKHFMPLLCPNNGDRDIFSDIGK